MTNSTPLRLPRSEKGLKVIQQAQYVQERLWDLALVEPEVISSARGSTPAMTLSRRARPQSGLVPILKWAGGKTDELRHIMPLIPTFERYFEPFVGGGAVYFSLAPQCAAINDASNELMGLYQAIASCPDQLATTLDHILVGWDSLSRLMDREATSWIALYRAFSRDEMTHDAFRTALTTWIAQHHSVLLSFLHPPINLDDQSFMREIKRNLLSKTGRMKVIEASRGQLPSTDIVSNIECALKSAFYMHCRALYNQRESHPLSVADRAALFFFVRDNAYASMFRYNKQGEFNVPYGGMSYNRKDIARKVSYMVSEPVTNLLQRSTLCNQDFAVFLQEQSPGPTDFMFIDPPYDSDFSTYAGHPFTLADHTRLATYLTEQCPAKFMAVIKNTPAIFALYDKPTITINSFDKTYMVSFQDRNDRQTEHLLITNY